jgi:hypothetical protein
MLTSIHSEGLPDPGPAGKSAAWGQLSVMLEGFMMKKRGKRYIGQGVFQRRYFLLCNAEGQRALHYFAGANDPANGKEAKGKTSLWCGVPRG